jgi:hypothetical protein
VYELDPGPINILSNPNAAMTFDEGHPVYHRNIRAVASFKSNEFHFGVMVDASLHKKATIRHGVKRRFKQALLDYMREIGWDPLGQPKKKTALETLHGALLIKISDADPWAARELPWPEVQELSKWALDQFIEARNKNDTTTRNADEESAALLRKLAEDRQRVYDLAYKTPWGKGHGPDGHGTRRTATRIADKHAATYAPPGVSTGLVRAQRPRQAEDRMREPQNSRELKPSMIRRI